MRRLGSLAAGVATAAAVWVLGTGAAGVAHAQSSANFALSPGMLGAMGGGSSSASYMLTGTSGSSTALERSSSPTRDAVSGFIGGAFSSQAVVALPTAATTFASIAVPVNAADKTPASVFDELGPFGNTTWKVGRWSPVDDAYSQPGGTPDLTSIERGHGYWLISAAAGNAEAIGLPAPQAAQIVALQNGPSSAPGWNQVGNPFLYPINVSDLQVRSGVTIDLDSPANLLTEQTVKVWNGSAYVDATVINGRTAFWVRKLVPAGVDLIVNPVASTSGSPAPTLAKPPSAKWAVALEMSQGGRTAEPLMLGAAPVNAGEWNPLSASRAPSPPTGSHLVAFVEKTDWGRMSGQYVRDFRPAAETMSWDFVVDGAESPGQMTLTVTAFDLPAGHSLRLTDQSNGSTRDASPGDVLTYAALEGPHRFRLVATGDASVAPETPLAESLRFAYPNPFTQSVGLTFTLPAPGDIRVSVFDLQGRRVQTLERPNVGAGEHVLIWDGRDASGRLVAEGVYLTRYQVGSTVGTSRLVKLR